MLIKSKNAEYKTKEKTGKTMTMTMTSVESIVGFLMLLLILIACKPGRFFSSSSSLPLKTLVSDDVYVVRNQGNEFPSANDLHGACLENEGHLRSQGNVYKQRLPNIAPTSTQSDSLVLDVISDASEDIEVGQTLKRSLLTHQSGEDQRTNKQNVEEDRLQQFVSKEPLDERTCLNLEVISGPSRGLCCSIQSTNSSRLPLTLGRVAPNDLILKDSEVSGKHASINWNLNVHISSQNENQVPFGVGLASDPMTLRRGGKKLPMEDVGYYQWPLNGMDQFGIFGICDGHGGAEAAKSASKLLPEIVASLLSDSLKEERVLLQCDASEVLRDAFDQTERSLNYHYEGCTASVLLIWADGDGNFFAQCANLGDSACVINVDGRPVKMTEDHRITSHTERLRIQETGEPLKEGETRLCGVNLARMLGDKFLKQQDSCFSSDPYISQVVHIDQASTSFALMASDGFWDVISGKKVVLLVLQAREKYVTDEDNLAEKTANMLLSEARTMRTKDNTSIIFLDFSSSRVARKGGS